MDVAVPPLMDVAVPPLMDVAVPLSVLDVAVPLSVLDVVVPRDGCSGTTEMMDVAVHGMDVAVPRH